MQAETSIVSSRTSVSAADLAPPSKSPSRPSPSLSAALRRRASFPPWEETIPGAFARLPTASSPS